MYEREHANMHNVVAIIVMRGRQVIRHIPERLAEILMPLLKDGRLRKIDGWITGEACA